MKNSLRKIIIGVLLFAFGLSMQSFIGVRIEKRHYRKGYYVHIWHNPKTQPVRATTEKVVVKEEKQVSKPVAQARKQEASPSHEPQRSHDDQPQRSIAPVSRALDN
jgi:hypothetical protein